MEHGFQSSSLRNIVKEAGVTTGAFYGYYKTKEELFDAIVNKSASSFLSLYDNMLAEFEQLSVDEQVNSLKSRSTDMKAIVDCVYEDCEAFQLIIYQSKGTRYEDFIHQVMQREMDATHRFTEIAKIQGAVLKEIDGQLEHLLLSGFFWALFELVVHNIPKEKAYTYTAVLQDFYMAGWEKIMGF